MEGEDGELTWSDLADEVDALAGELVGRGVGASDRVIVGCPPGCGWVICVLATMRAGAIAVPVDPATPEAEASRVAELIEPQLALGAFPGADRFAVPMLSAQHASPARSTLPAPATDGPALIVATSGTTGQRKAVVHSLRTLALAGEGFAHWTGLTDSDRIFVCLPLFHVNAIFYSWMGSLASGATLVLARSFSVSGFWDQVKRAKATEVNLMGSMLQMLLDRTKAADADGHRLRLIYSAGAPASVQMRFERIFAVSVLEGYGLSETPYGCINPLADNRPGSLGRPRHHPEGRVRNEVAVMNAAGEFVEPGSDGEIVIRNDAMFLEYWRDPDATRAAFRDGWLRTQDLGRSDHDGYLWFRGRLGDVIRRNGVNISPIELEQRLAELDPVAEVAVVGVPDSVRGEEVVAVVVPADGDDSLEQRVLDGSREILSREKVPDGVVVTDHLPFTATGRVQRARLRAWLVQRSSRRLLGP